MLWTMDQGFKISGNRISLVVNKGIVPPQTPSVFSLGNGFIGVRGVAETPSSGSDKRPVDVVYLNGVYELQPISYHEGAYGYPDQSEVRIPVLDCTGLEIEIAGETIPNKTWRLVQEKRHLDTATGVLYRCTEYLSREGQRLTFNFERFVSCDHTNVVGALCEASSVGFVGEIIVRNHIRNPFGNMDENHDGAPADEGQVYDPRIGPGLRKNPWVLEQSGRTEAASISCSRAVHSGVCVATAHGLSSTGTVRICQMYRDGQCTHEAVLSLDSGQTKARIESTTVYVSSRNCDPVRLMSDATGIFEAVSNAGFAKLKERHTDALGEKMSAFGLALPANGRLEGALRFNLLQVFMAVGKDGRTSIGAKGQTGEGYEGHTFWDAELFVLPALLYAHPEIARSMLAYRYSMLKSARANAAVMGHKTGALFPWRTITGRECSSFFPAGAAQYHINADIAYAIQQYFYATDDLNFLIEFGLELLVETARIWPEVGFFNSRKNGAFCINRVTGPDEYSAIVDNNLYTNVMAKNHLMFAVEVLEEVAAREPDRFRLLAERLEVRDKEIAAWRDIAAAMYLPYDDKSGLYLQDEHTLDKELWDFAGTPKNKYPLLLHFHPLVIYRYQVAKQADTVLAMVLCGDLFSPQEKRTALEYYESVTVHDSTLSPGTFAILAADCDQLTSAFKKLQETSYIDLDDLHQNSDQGLHMAASASAWNTIVFGFAGMRTYKGKLSFSPKFFEQLGAYKFQIRFRGRVIVIDVSSEQTRYALNRGDPIEIEHYGARIMLEREHIINEVPGVSGLSEAVAAR